MSNGNSKEAVKEVVIVTAEESFLPAVIAGSSFFQDVFGDGANGLHAFLPGDWADLAMIRRETGVSFTHGLKLIEEVIRNPRDWFSPGLQPDLIKSLYAGIRLFIRPFVVEVMMGKLESHHLIPESDPAWRSLKNAFELALGVAEELRTQWSEGRQANAIERLKLHEVDDLLQKRQDEFLRRLFSGLEKLAKIMDGINFGEGGVEEFLQQVNSGQTEVLERKFAAIQARWEQNSRDFLKNQQRARELDEKRLELDKGWTELATMRAKLEAAKLDFDRKVDHLNGQLDAIKVENTKLVCKNTGLQKKVETLTEGLKVVMTDLVALRDKAEDKVIKTVDLKDIEAVLDNVPSSLRDLLAEQSK